jgi:hypothetical protein
VRRATLAANEIRIRVETIDYFLRRYREAIIQRRMIECDIEAELARVEQQLRRTRAGQHEHAAVATV